MSHLEHKKHALKNLSCGVITISDTRTQEDDGSGRTIRESLEADGHGVVFYSIVRDEAGPILSAVQEALENADVVICNGGTGISPRDITIETLRPLFNRIIEGFGEVFRSLSYDEIGSSAILSRSIAGVVGKNLLFCLPGSPNAVKLAMEKLILPEIGHMLAQVRK